MHRDSRGQPYFDPDDIAAAERLRRVRAAARAQRPGAGQVFVYAGRRVGGVSLSDIDLRTVAAAAGGLMVQEQEARIALAMRRAGMDVPVILDPARYLYPISDDRRAPTSAFALES